MINDIILGQYMPTGSAVHNAAPKMKIISLLIFTVSVFLVKNNLMYFYFLLIGWFILKISRLGLRFIVKGLRPLLVLFIITFIFNILFAEGDKVIWQWGVLSVTEEGLVQGYRFLMRVLLLVVFATLLTLTTSPVELSDGLEECMRPLKKVKFPVHEFALMMTIALRFIPTLIMEIDKIKRAQEARGADFSGGNIFKRVASFVPILIPLFIMSFKRADELAIAMESRCYMGGEGRTKYKRHRAGPGDYLMLLISAASMFPVVYLYFRP